MHADDAAGVLGRGRDRGHRQRRRVGREDGRRARDPVQLGEDLPLDLHPLRDHLDGQVDGRSFAEPGCRADPGTDLGLLAGGQFAPAYGLREAGVQDAKAVVQRAGVDLDRDDPDPGPREYLGYPGAHRAEADDRYLANVHAGDITVGSPSADASTCTVSPGSRPRPEPCGVSCHAPPRPQQRPRSRRRRHVREPLVRQPARPAVPARRGRVVRGRPRQGPRQPGPRLGGRPLRRRRRALRRRAEHEHPEPRSGRGVPARQHPAVRHHRPGGQPRRARRQDARAVQRPGQRPPAAVDGRLRRRLHQRVHRRDGTGSRATTSTRRS